MIDGEKCRAGYNNHHHTLFFIRILNKWSSYDCVVFSMEMANISGCNFGIIPFQYSSQSQDYAPKSDVTTKITARLYLSNPINKEYSTLVFSKSHRTIFITE